MGGVRRSPIDRVHLISERLDWSVNEESRVAVTCTAPHDIRRKPIIPLSDLFNDLLALRGVRKIGTDIMELLPVQIRSRRLGRVSIFWRSACTHSGLP